MNATYTMPNTSEIFDIFYSVSRETILGKKDRVYEGLAGRRESLIWRLQTVNSSI